MSRIRYLSNCARFLSKMHIEHLQNEANLRDLLQNVSRKHDPARHESAIYIAGTVLKLQNAHL